MESVIKELKNFDINQMRLKNLKKRWSINIVNLETGKFVVNDFDLECGKFIVKDLRTKYKYNPFNPSGEYEIYWLFNGDFPYNGGYYSSRVEIPKCGVFLPCFYRNKGPLYVCVGELKERMKMNKIKGYSKMKKRELIKFLRYL